TAGGPLGKRAGAPLVLEEPAVAIPFLRRQTVVLGFAGLAGWIRIGLVVPPAIELQIPNRNSLIAVTLHQRLQRAGITELAIVLGVVLTARVGPVAQI